MPGFTNDERPLGSLLRGIFIAVLLFAGVFFILNLLGILSLSTLYPKQLGWLPTLGQKATPKAPEEGSPTGATVNGEFIPQDQDSLKGSLVDEYIILYKLKGRVTKIAKVAGNDTYELRITANDGGQTFYTNEAKGEFIVRSLPQQKDLDWSDLREGDEVLANVTITSKPGEKAIIGVSQVALIQR